jgi:hypothetical protein
MLKSLIGVLAFSAFLVGLTARPSEAATITVQFYVQVDSIQIGPVPGLDLADLPSPPPPLRGVVGDKLFGSVTYDDAGIPDVGAYAIGMSAWDEGGFGFTYEELYGPSVPVQEWSLEWGGLTTIGFRVPEVNQLNGAPPFLMFTDGRPSGFEAVYFADLVIGLRLETIYGTHVEAGGLWTYPSNVPEIPDFPEIGWSATGTLHFLAPVAVPDTGSTFLFALTAFALVGALSKSVKGGAGK